MNIPQNEITGFCDACHNNRVSLKCLTCLQDLCQACDEEEHKVRKHEQHIRNQIDESISILLIEISEMSPDQVPQLFENLREYLCQNKRSMQRVFISLKEDAEGNLAGRLEELKRDYFKQEISILKGKISRNFIKNNFSNKNLRSINIFSRDPEITAQDLVSKSLQFRVSFNKIDMMGGEIQFEQKDNPFMMVKMREIYPRSTDLSFGHMSKIPKHEEEEEERKETDLTVDMNSKLLTPPFSETDRQWNLHGDELKNRSSSFEIERVPAHSSSYQPSTALNSSLEERPKSYDSSGSPGDNSISLILSSSAKPLTEKQATKKVSIRDSFLVADIVQNMLRRMASEGDLMIPSAQFKAKLNAELRNFSVESILSREEDLMSILEKEEIIHTTTRKFGEKGSFQYVSMFLREISIEALNWCLLSLKKDRMTPREKLVYSRLKESFGIDLSTNSWRGHLNYLLSLGSGIAREWSSFPQEKAITIPIKNLSTKILIKCEKDAEKNSDVMALYPEGKEYQCDDSKNFDEADQPLWKQFLAFLDEFFDSGSQINETAFKKNVHTSSTGKWPSSVENIFTKTGGKKPPFQQPKTVAKTIPGGKYGAAQFVKCCGPEELRNLSLGKLTLFVQETIFRNVLIYHKTNLMKATNIKIKQEILNDLTKGSFSKESIKLNPAKEEKLKEVIKVIVDILRRSMRGVTLSKLPKLISESAPHLNFDLHEFGFSKLKQLLVQVPEIELSEESGNHTYARLRVLTSTCHPSSSLIGNESNVNKPYRRQFQTMTEEELQETNSKSPIRIIQEIVGLSESCDTEALLEKLNTRLGKKFDFSISKCKSWEQFLVEQADMEIIWNKDSRRCRRYKGRGHEAGQNVSNKTGSSSQGSSTPEALQLRSFSKPFQISNNFILNSPVNCNIVNPQTYQQQEEAFTQPFSTTNSPPVYPIPSNSQLFTPTATVQSFSPSVSTQPFTPSSGHSQQNLTAKKSASTYAPLFSSVQQMQNFMPQSYNQVYQQPVSMMGYGSGVKDQPKPVSPRIGVEVGDMMNQGKGLVYQSDMGLQANEGDKFARGAYKSHSRSNISHQRNPPLQSSTNANSLINLLSPQNITGASEGSRNIAAVDPSRASSFGLGQYSQKGIMPSEPGLLLNSAQNFEANRNMAAGVLKPGASHRSAYQDNFQQQNTAYSFENTYRREVQLADQRVNQHLLRPELSYPHTFLTNAKVNFDEDSSSPLYQEKEARSKQQEQAQNEVTSSIEDLFTNFEEYSLPVSFEKGDASKAKGSKEEDDQVGVIGMKPAKKRI